MRRRKGGSKSSKKKDQARHARNRALERYDIVLTKDLANAIKKKIGYSRLIYKQSLRVSIFAIQLNSKNIPEKWRNKDIPIVWDRQRQQIVSFLPQKALESYVEGDE